VRTHHVLDELVVLIERRASVLHSLEIGGGRQAFNLVRKQSLDRRS